MLGQRIRELRIAKNMNQVKLAELVGVTKQSVSNWENDNIQPSVDIIIKLVSIFDVSADYLLELDNSRSIDVSDLSPEKIAHIQLIIDDMRNSK